MTALLDQFGRVHTSIRISVTDRCNLRCNYCMPAHGAVFAPRAEVLTFEEITRVVRLLADRCGVTDVRITGGEPLVRRDLPELIGMLSSIGSLDALSMTTNAILMTPSMGERLRDAGMRRVNISLDTLDRQRFQEITRRDEMSATLDGIRATMAAGFDSVKINTLAMAGLTEAELLRLVRYAIDHDVVIRFIEFMPLDADAAWTRDRVLDGDAILAILRRHFGSVTPIGRHDRAAPAERFAVDGGIVGIIRSVSQPFCSSCNRIRLTADGGVRNCLFASTETPIRDLMRGGGSDDELIAAIRDCVAAKAAAHGIDHEGFEPPERPMYAIGG